MFCVLFQWSVRQHCKGGTLRFELGVPARPSTQLSASKRSVALFSLFHCRTRVIVLQQPHGYFCCTVSTPVVPNLLHLAIPFENMT